MIELTEKYTFHIPLYKSINNKLVPIDIDEILKCLIEEFDKNGYDSLYIENVKGYYNLETFDEILINIFTSKEMIKTHNSPDAIFKQWFNDNNDILEQLALGYEYNNKMYIEKF